MTDNVRELPAGEVDFDLDSVEKDASDQIPDFVCKVGGKPLSFGNPDEIEWQDLINMEDPTEMFQYVLSEDDRRHLNDTPLTSWKLGKLMDAFQKHFKFEERAKKAQRERDRLGRNSR